MAQEADQDIVARPRGRKRRILRHAFRVLIVLLLAGLALGWLNRERLADDLISHMLEDRGVPASYEIESIGPSRQVLTNLVIGDPDRPDFTVERIEVEITPRLGIPDVTALRLTRPRLFATYREGQLSFGALDPLVFTGAEEPFEFPSAELAIDDGRALVQTDHGDIGIKLSGSGHLRGGFTGELAMVAPQLQLGECLGSQVTLYGEVAIDAERPEFDGPLRLASLECGNDLSVRHVAIALDLQAERNLTEYEGDIDFATERVVYDEVQAALAGNGRFTWHDDDLNLLYDLAASDVRSSFATLGQLSLDGRLRALGGERGVELEGNLGGEGLRIGPEIDARLAAAEQGGADTLIQPLVAKLRRHLGPQLRGSTLAASFTARRVGEQASLVIPEAHLRNREGTSLLALSRVQLVTGEAAIPRFSGNFATAGEGLPQMRGRMEQAESGALEMRLAMHEYVADDARLTIPELHLVQGLRGGLTLDGRALASGPLAGGAVTALDLPFDAVIAPDGGLAMWNDCREVRFDQLVAADLVLDRNGLTLCPREGEPILRYDNAGLQVAATAEGMNFTGRLGEAGAALTSGPVSMTYPGGIVLRDLDVTLGEGDALQHFTASNLRADLSADTFGGDFSGADVMLAALPLDLRGAAGTWSYASDGLHIADAAFTVADRQPVNRFEPLVARGASLVLADGRVRADAALRHPATNRVLSRVEIAHDLDSGIGHTDLFVDGVTFGPDLQPAPPPSHCMDTAPAVRVPQSGLSCLVLGLASDVRGTVSGRGRIDWNAERVTSHGTFSSDSLDAAVAFGPVHGMSGTITFTDLLNLTTAPDQHIYLREMNPGVVVNDGVIGFTLIGGERLEITGGQWPFMGGTLTLRPVDLNIGVAESRTYVIVIEGLQAGRFVEHMELGNLAATGTFDGTIPIVFDADGNGQLVAGELVSRPPGGNLAYVGELTYEDMGFFANYAFRTLRDLRYDRMDVLLNGPLAGELVTQVRFEGIGQGELAERNFISRAIGRLPIELRVNVRAPFYQLISSLSSLYDPAAVRDPRSLGLVTDDGAELREQIDFQTLEHEQADAAAEAERRLRQALNPDEAAIQPQESETPP